MAESFASKVGELERALALVESSLGGAELARVRALVTAVLEVHRVALQDVRRVVGDAELGRAAAAEPSVAWVLACHDIDASVLERAVSAAEADAYWVTRPRLSQLGALASHQSRPYAGRLVLVRAVARLRLRYRVQTIPRPAGWNGYRIAPRAIEFWTRGAFRLHTRLLFTRSGSRWKSSLLQP